MNILKLAILINTVGVIATSIHGEANDNPVELFGNFKYESSTSSGKTGNHAIVTYESDCKDLDSWVFKCHLGWRWRNEVVVTEYVLGSIFSFSCK